MGTGGPVDDLAWGTALTRFVLFRLLRGLLTVVTVASIVFVASRVSGDPTQWLLSDDASEAQRQELRSRLGLDDAVVVQWGRYLASVAQGDFGQSFRERRPVALMFAERIPATLRLAGLALLVAIVVGVPVGILAALHRDRPLDRALMSLTFVGQALPNFVLGILAILLFSLFLRALPSGGSDSLRHYILPVLTLSTGTAATLARFTRSGLLEVLGQDYMRTAAAKGLPRRSVLLKHGLRNASLSVLTILGFQLGSLITGSVIVETVFAWPGMGRLIVNAVTMRDYPVLQFSLIVVSASIVLANALVDILYGVADPRIRTA